MTEQPRKSFDQLVSEKASCAEFAWNGYIRIYEEGEKRCECENCKMIISDNYALKKRSENA